MRQRIENRTRFHGRTIDSQMSGICGIFRRSGEALPPGVLDPMMEAMRQYGREGGQTWQAGAAALGHQMTWVTPESQQEVLPYEDSESRLAITADARLDNREELGALLGIEQEQLKEMPDSQLVLHAYRRWGRECPCQLLGDFALAIYDPREHSLFLARDPLGVRPLYYYADAQWLYFASDLAALLAHPGVAEELNLPYVRSYLEDERFYHPEQTFYQEVLKLLPANTLLVQNRRLEVRAYWRPEEAPAVRYPEAGQYLERLRELVERAVECRLRSAYPTGSHLSGGLDSSVVAVLAARGLREKGLPLYTYSWGYPPQPEDYPLRDERALVEAISQKELTAQSFTVITADDYFSYITREITAQPTVDAMYESVVARAAGESGLRLMLSGWGGDEGAAFNGRGYFADLLRRGQWGKMTRELYLRARLSQASLWEGVRNNAVLPLIPDWALRLLRPASPQLTHPRALPQGLQAEFAAHLLTARALERSNLRERAGVRRNQLDLLHHGHLVQRMESWAVIGAQHGLEYRYPLLDRRVIEFALGVPPDFYFKDGWKRYTFRKFTESLLPPEASWKREKSEAGYRSNVNELLMYAIKEILRMIQENHERIEAAGLVDPAYLDDSFRKIISKTESDTTEIGDPFRVLWLALFNPDR